MEFARRRLVLETTPELTDLFTNNTDIGNDRPLADRMRPASLREFSGQRHLLEAGKPLLRAIEQGRAQAAQV